MKRTSKILVLGIAMALLTVSVFGCASSNATPTVTGGVSNVELYVYNSKGENATQFAEMCAKYTTETGIKVKAFSIGSGQDHMETLRSEMNSNAKPAVFSIQGLKELQEWEEGGFVLDFSKATETKFKDLANAIPAGLRLTTDGTKNYGVPYNVEGYGYIVDTQMIADLFGAANKDAFITDMKAATYSEFEAAVKAIDAYIKTPTAAKITVNGKPYTFAATKTGLAAKLNGVFAVMGAEKWTYGDHFVNVALNAAFASPAEAFKADAAKIDSLSGLFKVYAKALDLKTSYLAGTNGAAKRGPDFVSSANFGYDPTVAIFANSKAVFMKQGNWAYGNIETVNAEVAKRLEFLPVKMPITTAEISLAGMTPEKFNSSIPVFVPNYYAINAKVTAEEQKLAQNFLVWLNTSTTGMTYIKESFKFIPYNADPATTTLTNSLGNSILDYMKAKMTLAAPYQGAPASWSGDVLGKKIMEEYMTKATWAQADYDAIANYAVSQWKTLKG